MNFLKLFGIENQSNVNNSSKEIEKKERKPHAKIVFPIGFDSFYLMDLMKVDENLYQEAVNEWKRRRDNIFNKGKNVMFPVVMDDMYLKKIRAIDPELYNQAIRELDRRKDMTQQEIIEEFNNTFNHTSDEAKLQKQAKKIEWVFNTWNPVALLLVEAYKNNGSIGFKVNEKSGKIQSVELTEYGEKAWLYQMPVLKHMAEGTRNEHKGYLCDLIRLNLIHGDKAKNFYS